MSENKILGCARIGRAARLKQQAKCIELRDERGNANEVDRAARKAWQDYSEIEQLIMGDLQWCTGRSRAPERNSSAPTRGPWRSPFWQSNSNETKATTSTKATICEHRGRSQRLNVGAANDRHSLSGGLNTGSAIAVRFEPLSVMRDRWPEWTAAVRTSTATEQRM